jgi:hypothetical protein
MGIHQQCSWFHRFHGSFWVPYCSFLLYF